jgi:hypothetical protein
MTLATWRLYAALSIGPVSRLRIGVSNGSRGNGPAQRGAARLPISSVHFKLLPQLDPRHLVLLLQGTGNKLDIPIL